MNTVKELKKFFHYFSNLKTELAVPSVLINSNFALILEKKEAIKKILIPVN